jgi:hypothetical protein
MILLLLLLLLFVVVVVVVVVVVAVIAELPTGTDAYTTSLEPEGCTLKKLNRFTFKPCHRFSTFLVAVY